MRIGLLSKKTGVETFIYNLSKFLEKRGYTIELISENNLTIDNTLNRNDFYILKSKSLIYLYAAFFAEKLQIPVFPDPKLALKHKDRIESYYLIKNLNLKTPKFYMGTPEILKRRLKDENYPIILKPIMGSGSRGIKVVKTKNEFNSVSKKLYYFQEYISGIHYLVYFIRNETCILKKPPFSNEHVPMELISPQKDILEIVKKWRNACDHPFGHLDMVRDENTNELYIVDVGCFPEFSNWKGKNHAIELVGEIILNTIKKKIK